MMSMLLAQSGSDLPAMAGSNVEWANQTTLHPLGLILVLTCGFALLALPRRYALWPIIVVACLVAPAQRLVVAGLDFNLLRILVLFTWARIIIRGETAGFVWKPLDTVLLLWAIVSILTYTLLIGSTGAFINRTGMAFDAVGMYFAFRCLLRTWDDLDRTVLGFIAISVPVAFAFLVEWSAGRNGFSFFGGVPEVTMVREGRLRCQGPFAHPILAGCFWAALLPIISARWWMGGGNRVWVVTGLTTSCVIIFTCSSSTPLIASLVALVATGMFYLRHQMRMVRWGLVISLVCLHMIREPPVWHLISRVSTLGGSTGWHRHHLIDQTIKRFEEWWLLGTPTTAHWGWGLEDVTNQYVLEAVRGGLLTLTLFVSIIVIAFRQVGHLCDKYQRDPVRLRASWALGAMLLVHVTSFVAVSYFGQIIMLWYLCIAMIASLAPEHRIQPRPINNRMCASLSQCQT